MLLEEIKIFVTLWTFNNINASGIIKFLLKELVNKGS